MPLHQLVFIVFCSAVSGYSILRGGAPERATACSFVFAMVSTIVFKTPHQTFFAAVEVTVAAIDGVLLVIVVALALLSTRYWALPMASMQIVDIFGHLAKAVDPTIWPTVYFFMAAMISWPMVALLGWATWSHGRRLRRYGVDFSWTWQLPRAYRDGWLVGERRPEPRGRPA